ncbi:hypothetical protein [Streptomyces longispororuber]|uniref:hypothetical protein n=1 Tax=Streptomyces longispororuber TaxID=68230 RepID=UPI0036F7E137
MSSGQKTMTLFVTVILGLIFVILGLSASWPLWAWPTTGAILLVIAVVTHGVLSRGADEPPGTAAFGPGPELFAAERPERRVTHVALPSAAPDYDFSFSATVCWTELEAGEDAPEINAGALAVDAVLQRARALTELQPPTHSALVQHQLHGALGTMRTDPTGRVLAMAEDVSLTLPDVDRERLCKLADVRKDEDVWEHERNYERSKRTYLGDDVLKDTGSAVVWWLSRNDEEVEAAVDRIGLLARLSAAANNDTVAPPFAHLVPSTAAPEEPFDQGAPGTPSRWQDIAPPYDGRDTEGSRDGNRDGGGAGPDAGSLDAFLSWFGVSPDDPEAPLLAERARKLAEAHGADGLAEALRRRYGQGPPDDDTGEDPPQPAAAPS